MKRWIKALLGILGLILAIGLVIGLALDALIKTGLETIGPRLLGAPVAVDDVDMSLVSGEGEIEGLVIANPPGFETDHAIRIDRVRFAMDAPSALTNTIVIRQIVIEGPEIVFEGSVSGKRSNIETLRRNVEQHLQNKRPPAEAPATSDDGKASPQVHVDRLLISNAMVKLSLVGLKGRTLSIPLGDIDLRHLGKKEGHRTIADAIAQVLEVVNDRILTAMASDQRLLETGLSAVENAVTDLSDDMESAASKALEGLKGILGE